MPAALSLEQESPILHVSMPPLNGAMHCILLQMCLTCTDSMAGPDAPATVLCVLG